MGQPKSNFISSFGFLHGLIGLILVEWIIDFKIYLLWCTFGSFGQEIPVHKWPAGADGHTVHTPASGVTATDEVDVCVFYGMW